MIRFGSPSAPPPPPPPPLPIPSSSSCYSSTLSPLAPPFTVDRQPYRFPPPSLPQRNAEEKIQSESLERSNSVDPTPNYTKQPSPSYKGGNAESFIAYESAHASWNGKPVDSSASQFQFGSECPDWGGHPAIYQERATAACDNMLSYFHSEDTNFVMKECSASKSNSSYDKYIAQLVSSSTDPVVYYPVKTSSSSSQVYAPSAKTNSSSTVCSMLRKGHSTIQHGNQYKVSENYADYILAKRKDSGVYQYSEDIEGYAERSMTNNNMNRPNITQDSSLMTACSSIGDSMDCSLEAKSGFRVKHANLPGSYASGKCGLPKHEYSIQTFSGTLDKPSLAVDSSCWNGAPVSGKSSFGVCEIVNPNLVMKEMKGCYALDQEQKTCPLSTEYLGTLSSSAKDGGFICTGHMRNSSYLFSNSSPNISLYKTEEQILDAGAGLSVCARVGNEKESARVGNEKESHTSDAIKGESNGPTNSLDKYSEQGSSDVKQLGQEVPVSIPAKGAKLVGEIAYPDTCLMDAAQVLPSAINSDVQDLSFPGLIPIEVFKPVPELADKCLTAAKDVKLLVKAMHGLSEVLLGSYENGVDKLEDRDHELVQLLIGNVEAFICKNEKGIAKCSSHVPWQETGQSEVSVSKTSDTGNNQIKKTSTLLTKHSLEKAFEEKIPEQEEENPQATLYKKLWIKAEAALCSMKYELARLKLEKVSYEYQKKGKESMQATISLNSDSLPSFDEPRCMAQEGQCHKVLTISNLAAAGVEGSKRSNEHEAKTNNGEEIDPSVMARLGLLKGRYDRANAINIEEQLKCSGITDIGLLDLSTRLADLGFMESKTPQPFTEDEHRDGSCAVSTGFWEPRVCTADSPSSQAYIPTAVSWQGKQFLTGFVG